MKKIFILMLMAVSAITVSAQTVVQSSKFLDNVYAGVEAGAATPLALDKVFPLNSTVSLRLGKEFTPVWGIELSGTAWLGSNATYGFPKASHHFDGFHHNAVRGSYVAIDGLINLTNMFAGYNGSPRPFEVGTAIGFGWAHTYMPYVNDRHHNQLGGKTGLDFKFNLGSEKQHTVAIRPAVLWNLSQPGNETGDLAFNKLGAQLYVGLGYVYHFKTSNGTRHFKLYDLKDYEKKIANLNAQLSEKPKQVIVYKERPVTKAAGSVSDVVVFFSVNSDVLSDEAKLSLDKVKGAVKVSGYASPEGSENHNMELSYRRAVSVADYLRSKGVTVVEVLGFGANGETSNRVVIVTAQ